MGTSLLAQFMGWSQAIRTRLDKVKRRCSKGVFCVGEADRKTFLISRAIIYYHSKKINPVKIYRNLSMCFLEKNIF